MALNGGPEFKINPSVSFMVHCETETRLKELWETLSQGGKVMMPLDSYPFSPLYGWIEDRYGVSWQLILPQNEPHQKVMPVLMFVNKVCGKAREAINYYTSIFHETKTGTLAPYPEGMEPDQAGTLMYADFMLEGQWLGAMDSARMHDFDFNEAISFMVHCDTQQEIDYYWDKLTAEGKEVQCGWLRDKYGVTWQIVPTILPELLNANDQEKGKRVMQALMSMVKLDIAQLEQA
jgi:predicted 3-demethylubiquinone-9 3-methyltransferase (glyoxalase superfamily)